MTAELVAGAPARRATRSSTSARRLARAHALARARASSAPLRRVPVPRPARLRGRRPRASSSAARRSWPTSSAASRPAACWPSSARRAAASPRCCAPASSPPCAPARSTGSRAPRCSYAGRRPGARRRGRAGPRCSSSTSSRSCSRSATTPTGGGRSSTACCALRCAVAIGVRADFYGAARAATPSSRAPSPPTRCCSGAMTADELERAITEPARLAGLRLEPGLVELVLRDVADEPGALPLLSHALRATWERRDGRTLTVDGLPRERRRRLGDRAHRRRRRRRPAGGAAPARARRLPAHDRARRRHRGHAAARGDRRARPRARRTRRASTSCCSGSPDARLVTLDDGTAEVAHEALIREWPRLRRWLDEDRAGMRVHRSSAHAARLWDAGGREPSDLYRGARLAARGRARPAELNATERAFLDASVAEADRERRAAASRANRRLRGLLVGGHAPARAWRSPAACSRWSSATTRGAAVRRRGAGADLRRRARRRARARRADARAARCCSPPPGSRSRIASRPAATCSRSCSRTRRRSARCGCRASRSSPSRPAPTAGCWRAGTSAGVVRFTDLRTWKPVGATVKLPEPVAVAGDAASRRTGARWRWARGRQTRSELHLVDVATRRARRIGSWPGASGPTSSPTSRSPSRRTAAGSRSRWPTGSPTTSTRPVAQRFMLLDARTGRRLWQRRYPLPARPDGGARPVRPRRRADHARPRRARRWCGTLAAGGSCAATRSAGGPRSRPTGARSPWPSTARTRATRAPPSACSTCAPAAMRRLKRQPAQTSGS